MTDDKTEISAKIWSSWEIRSLRFIFRFMAALLFLIYLMLTAQTAWLWGQMKWVRSQDIAQLESLLAAAEKKDDFSEVEKWVSLRPLAETDALMEKLEPATSLLPGTVFNEFVRRLELLKRDEEVLFWSQFTRYRLRYDALRCGAPDAPKIVTSVQEIFPNKSAAKLLEEDQSRLARSIRQVLDYDAKYPARDNPVDFCESLNKMQKGDYPMSPRETWADVRYTLRMVTEAALEKMESAPKTPAPPEKK